MCSGIQTAKLTTLVEDQRVGSVVNLLDRNRKGLCFHIKCDVTDQRQIVTSENSFDASQTRSDDTAMDTRLGFSVVLDNIETVITNLVHDRLHDTVRSTTDVIGNSLECGYARVNFHSIDEIVNEGEENFELIETFAGLNVAACANIIDDRDHFTDPGLGKVSLNRYGTSTTLT
jgi:hypothetical protein